MAERRPISRRAFVAALISSLPLASCVLRHAGEGQEDDSDLFTLEIVNHHRLNVTIFNVAQGRRDRIGEVTAAANATFRLHVRRYFGNEIQLFGDAVGSPETVTSEVLHIAPDDVVEWTLETELARSHVTVR